MDYKIEYLQDTEFDLPSLVEAILTYCHTTGEDAIEILKKALECKSNPYYCTVLLLNEGNCVEGFIIGWLLQKINTAFVGAVYNVSTKKGGMVLNKFEQWCTDYSVKTVEGIVKDRILPLSEMYGFKKKYNVIEKEI
ncbi:MAG: hypothetical protein SV062_12445 [Thermodesulfobacteriota bacterium]|nr:hypothetical protein [Thermodesulfobacteriota bacterium]